MCCLFGILDYQGRLSLPRRRRRRQMLAVLARECEDRGTDAAGITYCVNRHMSVYKAPMPAHLVNFQPPAQAHFIMGHTRMATQGDEHCNYNNHPFKGRTGNTSFALAHNGVIHNDQLLKVQYQLPKTKIETDSYVAVQLLEKSGRLDFRSLRKMAEVMQGTFTFTVLDDKNNLYIVKGNNPMCIYHFPREGFYIYASTKEILDQAATKLRLNRRHRKEGRLSSKCNTFFLEENLNRGSPAETFPGTIVNQIFNLLKVFCSNRPEIKSFGKEESYQVIGVLVCSTLPRFVWLGKINEGV